MHSPAPIPLPRNGGNSGFATPAAKLVAKETTGVQIPAVDDFWTEFYLKPAELISEPVDYNKETEVLTEMCKSFVNSVKEDREIESKKIRIISDEYALESPLTPGAGKMFENPIAETFTKFSFVICRCEKNDSVRCRRKSDDSDWYSGHCGQRVLRYAYSYIHVNLSRKTNSFEVFVSNMEPLFRKEDIPFRVIPGDSGLTVAIVASDRMDEKAIQKLLRSKPVKVDLGLRIFRTSSQLVPSKPRDDF